MATLVFAPPEPPEETTKAFPSAEGFGAGSEGPRGAGTTPTLYRVDTLADSGTGSLRAALEATGPRFVVFDVAGNIELESAITIEDPYLYVAGQTAPHGGVCIRAAAGYLADLIEVSTAHAIFRHMRVRVGFMADQYPSPTPGSAGQSSMGVNHTHGAQHVIWDHCSFTWGTDGNIQTGKNTQDVTFQFCIISKALMTAGHNTQPHGRPANFQYAEDEINPDTSLDYGPYSHVRITVHHCLMSHGEERFPQISTGTGHVEVINNVVYRTRDITTQVNSFGNNIIGNSKARIVKNFYKTTNTATANGEIHLSVEANRGDEEKVYVFGNIGEGRPTDTEDQWLNLVAANRSVAMGGTAGDDPITVTDPLCHTATEQDFGLADIPVTETTAQAAYNALILADPPILGATVPLLDVVDEEIIDETANNTGTWIDHPGQRADPDDFTFDGGYPDLTTGGSSSLYVAPANPFTLAANGYMNIENDLNELAGDTIP